MNTTNWFSAGADAYARFRPDYPPELAAFLAGEAHDRKCAVDVGCGNGQFTTALAAHFAGVVGLDPSEDQIGHAAAHARVRYLRAPAEALPLPDRCAGLVTAAQAAHWFDLPAFYAEARRIAVPGATIALISYGIPQFDAAIDPRFRRFYRQEIGPFWPAERRLVETGYADLDFPFAERPYPALEIRRDWPLAALLGYVSTWSATRAAKHAGRTDLIEQFAEDLARLWGDEHRIRTVRWPIVMRLGRI